MKKINIDKNIFTFGNILPDIPNEYVVKEITHHVSHVRTHFEVDVLIVEHMEKRYDLKNFEEKYKSKFSNPLMLGYYVHLLTDYFWNDVRITRCICYIYFKNDKKTCIILIKRIKRG